MKKVLLILICSLAYGSLWAQTMQVSGVVTENNNPLAGVTVIVKGTTQGANADENGRYTISVPPNATLVFSFQGMKTQEIKVDARPVIDVEMEQDAVSLDEVIMVAYGTAKKSSYTGSASVVSGEKLAKLQTGNVTKALEGAASGVQFISNSGQPGAGGSIRIRGIGSLSASTTPLYVVDGMPFEGQISSINSVDIESMTVLKDAAANSLYGSRAANGVILITTKKGRIGKPRVTVEARAGVNQRAIPQYDLIADPQTFYELTWEAMRNNQYYSVGNTWEQAGRYASYNLIAQLGGYNNYNVPDNQLVNEVTGKLAPNAALLYHEKWDDEMFKTGVRQEYTATVSGGDEKMRYYLSLGYLNDEGYVVNSDFQRYSSRLRLDREVTKWLRVGGNVSYVKQFLNSVTENGSEGVNMFYVSQTMSPIYPVYLYEKGTGKPLFDARGHRYDFGDAEGYTRPVSSMTNAVASQSLDKQNENWSIFDGKVFAELKVQDFKLTLNYAIDESNNLGLSYQNGQYGQFKGYEGISTRYAQRSNVQTANQILSWGRSFDKHTIDAIAVHETYRYVFNYLYGQKNKFLDPNQYELTGAINNPLTDSYERKYTLESYLAQVQYNFDNKYYFSASFRTDGSSKFHPDHRWGNFWSVGASWRIKQEKFLHNATWLDDLKLKASYGTQGNDRLTRPDGTIEYMPYADQYKVVNNNDEISLVFDYKGNKKITWEKNGTFNAGLEFSMFRNRLFGDVEYFYKNTTDMLFNRPLPGSTGLTSYPDNIGDMVNKGVELELTGVLARTADLEWSVTLNATHFTNKITKLPPENREEGVPKDNLFKMMEGRSVYDYFMKEFAGLSADGEVQWYMDEKDASGNVTGRVPTTDFSLATDYFQGHAIPVVYGGIATSLRYKGIDFSVQASYQLGGKGYDHIYAATMAGNSLGVNVHKDIQNRWTPENTGTDTPRLQIGNAATASSRYSSRWFTSSDYFNLRNITLGYTFPKKWMDAIGLEAIRLYAVADNVLLFSARQGYDPRTSWAGTSGVGQYAPIRTISLGATLTF